MSDKLVVLTTAASNEEAQTIARQLVERRLAACVNIVPSLRSVYRWQEKVEQSDECLLLIKTAKSREAEVYSLIRQLHSYQLPESISIAVTGGTSEYLDWIDGSL